MGLFPHLMVERGRREGDVIKKLKNAELVRAAAKGDKDAFVELIDQYRQTMYATAMAVTRSEEDAMDAIGDTILILWEKLDTLKKPEVFKTWMTRVLINCCCGVLRDRRREIPSEALEDRGEEPDLDTSLTVNQVLERLSEDDRLVLQLFYFEDMAVKDIARVLNQTQEAVRMRLSRGRKRFREQYERGEAL